MTTTMSWPSSVGLSLLHAVNCGSSCFWRRPSVVFLSSYEISPESLNGFAPNSHWRRVRSLARTSLNVKVKGQGHQGQNTAFFGPSAACVHFMFGKTSLASSYFNLLQKLLLFSFSICGQQLWIRLSNDPSYLLPKYTGKCEKNTVRRCC